MLVIACISLLALMVLGVPITFSLLGAGFLAVSLGGGGLPMYMTTTAPLTQHANPHTRNAL